MTNECWENMSYPLFSNSGTTSLHNMNDAFTLISNIWWSRCENVLSTLSKRLISNLSQSASLSLEYSYQQSTVTWTSITLKVQIPLLLSQNISAAFCHFSDISSTKIIISYTIVCFMGFLLGFDIFYVYDDTWHIYISHDAYQWWHMTCLSGMTPTSLMSEMTPDTSMLKNTLDITISEMTPDKSMSGMIHDTLLQKWYMTVIEC